MWSVVWLLLRKRHLYWSQLLDCHPKMEQSQRTIVRNHYLGSTREYLRPMLDLITCWSSNAECWRGRPRLPNKVQLPNFTIQLCMETKITRRAPIDESASQEFHSSLIEVRLPRRRMKWTRVKNKMIIHILCEITNVLS